MTKPLSKPPIGQPLTEPGTNDPTRAVNAWWRDAHAMLDGLRTGVTIADADGTSADNARAINALLAALRSADVLEG